ncbi:MAD-domain-containing protein [Laetiporus sulphureus 93-53]|uniref:Spindle assembly checkpoint component MAD1 n=1 Tax=Laetiporus sulphureus 93-53 TaxID=1314785 RepID=A0A165B280_9APHY|nr:MAD-domain-containing protein [Laetiporus sulphureus 93-53]KZT00090.1 MAD-domain-containing protein [Laetiporus sulphureus 93-53]
MDNSTFYTPTNASSSSRLPTSVLRSRKRDSLAAELESDPQLSTSRRKQLYNSYSSNAAHLRMQTELAELQTLRAELQKTVKEQQIQIDSLERDRRFLSDREEEEMRENELLKKEREQTKRQHRDRLSQLQGDLQSLQEQYASLKDEHASLARSTSQTIATQKSQIMALTRQVSLLEDQSAEFKRLAEERNKAVQELQMQFDDLNASHDMSIHEEHEVENWRVYRPELERQLEKMHALEAENATTRSELLRMRDRHASIEVMREQNRDLERKARGAEELRDKVVRLEAELEASRKEREAEIEHAAPSTPSKTPVSITQSLSDLRLAHARLLEKHGSTVVSLRRRETELAESEQRVSELKTSVEQLQVEAREDKDKLLRRELENSIQKTDIDFLKAMLDSYSQELSQEQDIKKEGSAAERINQLEDLLAEYRASVLQTEQDLGELVVSASQRGEGEGFKRLRDDLRKEQAARLEAEKALEEAEKVSEALEQRIEELEQTLFELRGEIGAGRHLPPGMRVLSLRDNPAQQWEDLSKAAMDRLKGENEALLNRLKELEESGVKGGAAVSGQDLVPRESWEVLSKEKAELQDQLKQKEKRLLRLQQVFSAKSAEFREAIASILGVKLAFYPNGQVRVTSMFDLNAAFVFQPTGSGEGEGMRMQLVAQGEGGPEELPQLMQYWVNQEQCIPGFLASVTLQCYEASKLEQERSHGQ